MMAWLFSLLVWFFPGAPRHRCPSCRDTGWVTYRVRGTRTNYPGPCPHCRTGRV